jgi:hypothetical protein
MARLHNLTIKAPRVPSQAALKVEKEKNLTIAEYIITTCVDCDTEIAMTSPFDGQAVLCAACDRPQSHFEVGEDVLAIDCE